MPAPASGEAVLLENPLDFGVERRGVYSKVTAFVRAAGDSFHCFSTEWQGALRGRFASVQATLAQECDVVARFERRGDALPRCAREGLHGKAVRDQHAVITKLAPDEIADDRRYGCRALGID